MEQEKLTGLMRALARAEAQLGDKIRVCTYGKRMLELVEIRTRANRILAFYSELGELTEKHIQFAEKIISIVNEKEKIQT